MKRQNVPGDGSCVQCCPGATFTGAGKLSRMTLGASELIARTCFDAEALLQEETVLSSQRRLRRLNRNPTSSLRTHHEREFSAQTWLSECRAHGASEVTSQPALGSGNLTPDLLAAPEVNVPLREPSLRSLGRSHMAARHHIPQKPGSRSLQADRGSALPVGTYLSVWKLRHREMAQLLQVPQLQARLSN